MHCFVSHILRGPEPRSSPQNYLTPPASINGQRERGGSDDGDGERGGGPGGDGSGDGAGAAAKTSGLGCDDKRPAEAFETAKWATVAGSVDSAREKNKARAMVKTYLEPGVIRTPLAPFRCH